MKVKHYILSYFVTLTIGSLFFPVTTNRSFYGIADYFSGVGAVMFLSFIFSIAGVILSSNIIFLKEKVSFNWLILNQLSFCLLNVAALCIVFNEMMLNLIINTGIMFTVIGLVISSILYFKTYNK